MGAEIISKFITQQVAVAMAVNTKQYKKKINKLEKGGRDRVSGESTAKNGTRGGGCASKKKKTSQTQTNTKSIPPQKSASNLEQGKKKYPSKPLEGKNPKSRRCQQRYTRKQEEEKSSPL